MRDDFSDERMRIQVLPLASLIHNPNNPRRHTERQIRKLAKSIKAFGFIVPILIDEARTIVAGHGRALAARKLGMKLVPTICVGHLSPDELKAFSIADNKLADSDEVARAFRDDVARCSDMMPPGFRCLAGG